jgi:hypothetical protein
MGKLNYPKSLEEEVFKRVQRQLDEVLLDLYGESGDAVGLLSGPGNETTWVHQVLRTVGVEDGRRGLGRFLSALCDPIAPMLTVREATSPTIIDENARAVAGRFWSLALGAAVRLHFEHLGERPADSTLFADIGEVLLDQEGYGLAGFVIRDPEGSRGDFEVPSVPTTQAPWSWGQL